jgi:CobW/HypB/UreG, nucleotide-binding domain
VSRPRAPKPWIVFVGGFLGAGKTTLILAAAKELHSRGLRCAIVANDQGHALVDSAYASRNGLLHGEVTGGCFCCRLSKLMETMGELRRFSPDVIFAEPVGSCTDISATILQPLREYSDTFMLAPFTVLVDPARAAELLIGNAEQNLSFLFRKQLEEADLICLTKSDLGARAPDLGLPAVRQISATTGQGVEAWLDEVLSGDLSCGGKVLDIDYEEYARAEAALAWLNLQAKLRAAPPVSSAMLLGPLLDALDSELTKAGISICHLKSIVDSPSGFLKAAICTNGQEPVVEGALDASPATTHTLILNLRALGSSTQVREIVEAVVGRVPAEVHSLEVSCFHPAAPNPELRIPASARL